MSNIKLQYNPSTLKQAYHAPSAKLSIVHDCLWAFEGGGVKVIKCTGETVCSGSASHWSWFCDSTVKKLFFSPDGKKFYYGTQYHIVGTCVGAGNKNVFCRTSVGRVWGFVYDDIGFVLDVANWDSTLGDEVVLDVADDPFPPLVIDKDDYLYFLSEVVADPVEDLWEEIVKIDTSGTKIWGYVYKYDWEYEFYFSCAAGDNTGGVIVVLIGWYSGEPGGWVMRIRGGQLIWRYDIPAGETECVDIRVENSLYEDWELDIYYYENDVVYNRYETYKSLQNHTAIVDSEPGWGVDWHEYWEETTITEGSIILLWKYVIYKIDRKGNYVDEISDEIYELIDTDNLGNVWAAYWVGEPTNRWKVDIIRISDLTVINTITVADAWGSMNVFGVYKDR